MLQISDRMIKGALWNIFNLVTLKLAKQSTYPDSMPLLLL